jgi:hypothetical protein
MRTDDNNAGEIESLETFFVPVQLKIVEGPDGNNSKKGTKSGVLGNGMDVYKVSKVRLGVIMMRYLVVRSLD